MLSQRGNIEGSLKAFKRAVEADPNDETARSNLTTTYNNLGVRQCKKGKYLQAIEQFALARAQKPEDLQVRLNLLSALVALRDVERVDREARGILALRPGDPETIMKVANAFQKIEDVDTARTLLEKILASQPSNSQAMVNLGRLYYQQGNFSEARFHTERALELSPSDASASAFLQRISREEGVENRFERETSVHFSLTFEDKISKEWIKDLLDLFEEAYTKVGDSLGYYPSQRVNVIVYSPKDFHRVSTLPGWAGGLYDGKIRLPVPPGTNSPDQLKGAVFHEFAHHLVHLLSDGQCPTWLNEGIAQTVEGMGPSEAKRVLSLTDISKLPSLKQLVGPFSHAQTRNQAQNLYAESLLAVSIIIEEKGFSAIQSILSDLGQRKPIDEALMAGTGMTCENFDSRIRENLENSL